MVVIGVTRIMPVALAAGTHLGGALTPITEPVGAGVVTTAGAVIGDILAGAGAEAITAEPTMHPVHMHITTVDVHPLLA